MMPGGPMMPVVCLQQPFSDQPRFIDVVRTRSPSSPRSSRERDRPRSRSPYRDGRSRPYYQDRDGRPYDRERTFLIRRLDLDGTRELQVGKEMAAHDDILRGGGARGLTLRQEVSHIYLPMVTESDHLCLLLTHLPRDVVHQCLSTPRLSQPPHLHHL
jgi:hypothetical protein